MAVGTLQNRHTKVAPFEDDFNDGNYTGWSVWGGTWSASSYYARNTSGGTDRLVKAFTEPDYAISFSYYREDSSNEILLYFRAAGGSGGTLRLDLTGTYARIVDSASSPTQIAYSIAHGSATGTWYDGYVEVDGANVKVMLGEQGEMLEHVFNVATATTTDTARLEIRSQNGAARFDNIRILGDGLTQTTTYTYDDWGRMLSKARGGHSADYEYRQLGRLRTITTDFPDEAYTIYVTGGDGNRRTTGDGTNFVHYKYGSNYDMLSAETSGTWVVQRSWVHDPGKAIGTALAEIEGSNPSTGTYEYLWTDQVGSTRHVLDGSKAVTASFAYSPYGESLLSSGGDVTALQFSGKMWDGGTGLYFFPFRYYSPDMGRWTGRDPLGMVDGPNVYLYAVSSPIRIYDALGLACGPGDGFGDFIIPDKCPPFLGWNFRHCCADHDACYGCGPEGAGSGKIRKNCDDEFRTCMKDECRYLPLLQRGLCRMCAQTYFNFVHKLGHLFFRKGCEELDEGC